MARSIYYILDENIPYSTVSTTYLSIVEARSTHRETIKLDLLGMLQRTNRKKPYILAKDYRQQYSLISTTD